MKKNILFVHFDLRPGGAERVLINLLNALDKNKYNLSLLTIFKVGELVDRIPKHVKYNYIFKNSFRGFTTFSKFIPAKLLHKLFIREKYDIEIAYLETSPTRIVGGGTSKETRRIAWLHNEIIDPEGLIKGIYINRKRLINTYNSFDVINVVSKKALTTFKNLFPEITTPFEVVHNVNDVEDIYRKSQEEIDLPLDKQKINFVSVGRICGQKGYDRLLEVVKRLNNNGLSNKYQVYIIGKGPEEPVLKKFMEKHGINNVHFLGFKENPYKYLSKMDMFVCSSVNEGYSTAVTESILLKIPVITTENAGMDEILDNGKLGIITPNNIDSLHDAMKYVIENRNIIAKYINEIKALCPINSSSVIQENENSIDKILNQ